MKILLKDFEIKPPPSECIIPYKELHSQDESEIIVLGKAAMKIDKLDLTLFLRKLSELEHCLLPAIGNLEGQVQRLGIMLKNGRMLRLFMLVDDQGYFVC